MATSLKYNAYHVLGLEGSASGRAILHRSNEIIQRLKIDDHPEYPLDIIVLGHFRSEDSVRDAVRRLQAPKLKLAEYFFWFRVDDELDKEATRCLIRREYHNATNIWQMGANVGDEASFRYKRNLALAQTVALAVGGGEQDLHGSLSAWKSLIESGPFWSAFMQTYNNDSDHPVSDEALTDFRENVGKYLSDIYAEMQSARGTTAYVPRFREFFSSKGERIEKDILDPIYRTMQGEIDCLEKIDVGEGNKFNSVKASQIKTSIDVIQTELNKLINARLFDDSASKVVRDQAASALRRIVLDLHNFHNELKLAGQLLEVASQIAGTDNFRSQLSQELGQVKKNIAEDEENTLTMEIPGALGGGTVIFKPDHLSYGKQKIFYREAISISYQASSFSLNLIPISQSYSYMVASKNERIQFSFGTTLYIGNKTKKEVWAKLAGISQHVIEPHVVEGLVSRIFTSGETVAVGEVMFSRSGYSRSKFLGGQDSVAWTDTVYVPTFSEGSVVMWKTKNGKSIAFATLSMSTPNAVVLPELVKACVGIVHSNAKR